MERIGFLGFGTMASAMARGWLRSGLPAARMAWYNPSDRMASKAQAMGMPARASSAEFLIAESDVVVLGLKPQQAPMALLNLHGAFRPGQVVISMLAGITAEALRMQLPAGVEVVRIMPNTPVAMGLGVVGLSSDLTLQPAQRALVSELLDRLGEVIEVNDDRMDELTAVCGSGPAFVYRFIEAMEAGAVGLGFAPDEARMMVAQTVAGAVELLADAGGDPASQRRAVTSREGMTDAGLRRMAEARPDRLMAEVFKRAAQRGRGLAAGEPPKHYPKMAQDLVDRAQPAARAAAGLSDHAKFEAIEAMAQAVSARRAEILAANAEDVARGRENSLSGALMDRLWLDDARLDGVIAELRAVGQLPDPVGRLLDERHIRDGLLLRKVAVPIGVVAVIFESRPNVAVDAAGLAMRSGNACILRCGKEARRSCEALVDALRMGLEKAGLDPNTVQLVEEQDRAFVGELLKQEEGIQLVVPRGGEGLIRAVVEQSRIPVVKHDKGLCSVYVHADADLAMAERIVVNAKAQRPGVCNAIENLFVDAAVAQDFLPRLAAAMSAHGVELRACERSLPLLPGAVPASPSDWDEEYLALVLAVRVVDGVDEAMALIQAHGSQHSDAIVTGDEGAARRYLAGVDSAAVYHNASTRYTDGACFGLGAEVGISTNRLHARGPMGLAELCTYKYQVLGSGQTRS